MNDTVQKLMGLADDYADERRLGFSQEDVQAKRQALHDELTRLFTPLSDEQIQEGVRAWFVTDIVPGQDPFLRRMRAAINAAHGIGGES